MALAITINKIDFAGATLRVYGSLVASGNYTTGGDALSLAGFDQIKASSAPDVVQLTSMTATVRTSSYVYSYLRNSPATLAGGKLQVWGASTGAAGLGEHANGAYNATVTGDVIAFEAVWFNRDI